MPHSDTKNITVRSSTFKNQGCSVEQLSWLLISVFLFQLSLPCLHRKYHWPKEMLVQLTLYLEKVKLRRKNHKSLASNIKSHIHFLTLTWMCQTYKIKNPIFPHLLFHRTWKALCLISVPKNKVQVPWARITPRMLPKHNKPHGSNRTADPFLVALRAVPLMAS